MPIAFEHNGGFPAVLSDICQSAELEGAAVLDLSHTSMPVTFSTGVSGVGTITVGRGLFASSPTRPLHGMGADKRPILMCPWQLPRAAGGAVLLWRAPGAAPWTEADYPLGAAVGTLLRHLLHTSAGQIGIDRLTGVPNRRWFIDEAERRIERLDMDNGFGTLTLVDVDDMARINGQAGRPAGDRVLVRLASQLRAVCRPSDLVARVGDDEFALWQDGMDHLTAAERADALCRRPLFDGVALGQSVTISIGIASHWKGGGEDIRTLLRRAHMAARDVKLQGGNAWRVSHAETTSR